MLTSQSPSLRGSGRFPPAAWRGGKRVLRSQSPSLRGSGRFSLGPLRGERRQCGLNPLHCGAVVASPSADGGRGLPRPVSIPFIAGQWSLRDGTPSPPKGGARSQSPSLRGSGRFSLSRWPEIGPTLSLNPLHCGAVVASRRHRCGRITGGGSLNPLHCGAVVASKDPPAARRGNSCGSQSPSLRGSGRFRRVGKGGKHMELVSIPFIAGQWSLLPRTTPSSLFGVLLRKRRLPCDHIICTRLPF